MKFDGPRIDRKTLPSFQGHAIVVLLMDAAEDKSSAQCLSLGRTLLHSHYDSTIRHHECIRLRAEYV